jgi:protein-S-isoprenylcysteine O-methyltransferase Ste14
MERRHILTLDLLRDVVVNTVAAVSLSFFVVITVHAYIATGGIAYLLIACNESLYAGLFFLREHAVDHSKKSGDWFVAFVATFLGTLLRPATSVALALGTCTIVVGVMVSIISTLTLNRSISIIPALRSIKTRGLYSIVRHPLYAGELLSMGGYVLVNASILNSIVFVGTVIFMLVRIVREEDFLARSAQYRSYLRIVRYKLVPFIY